MIARVVLIGLRSVLAAEFATAIGAWALGACGWLVAGAIATITLTTFLLTWDSPGERVEPAPESGPWA